jgi:hypothetical protein
MDISGASIPAASVITAIMPVRVIQEMRQIDPACLASPLLRPKPGSNEDMIYS